MWPTWWYFTVYTSYYLKSSCFNCYPCTAFHEQISPQFHIQGLSMQLIKMRHCAYTYFLPPCNQSEPREQKPSLPPSSRSLQPKLLNIQAAGLTKTVIIYQPAHCHIFQGTCLLPLMGLQRMWFWSGIKMAILSGERCCPWTRWRSSLNGYRMLKNVKMTVNMKRICW